MGKWIRWWNVLYPTECTEIDIFKPFSRLHSKQLIHFLMLSRSLTFFFYEPVIFFIRRVFIILDCESNEPWTLIRVYRLDALFQTSLEVQVQIYTQKLYHFLARDLERYQWVIVLDKEFTKAHMVAFFVLLPCIVSHNLMHFQLFVSTMILNSWHLFVS